MENILEIIFTIIVGFFWFFGGSIFNKREEDESYPQTSSRKNKRTRGNQADSDSEARQREIREAIRRKIAERRQQAEPEPMVAFEPEPQHREEYRKSNKPQEEVSKPLVFAESAEESVEVPFSLNIEVNAYEQEMHARLQEIEATERRAEALRSQMKQMAPDSEDTDSGKGFSFGQEPALSLGSVKSALKSPGNARAAFVYKEILEKPMGLRNPSEIGLGV